MLKGYQLIFIVVTICIIASNYINFSYKNFVPGSALVLGLMLSSIYYNNSLKIQSKNYSTKALNIAIILLGFGFNLSSILAIGLNGFIYIIISIICTLIIGLVIGKLLNNENKISMLISAGTAICGGSAIAAISPTINAKHKQIAISIGIIFLLNSIGLLIFPILGHKLNLSGHQFGIFAALAIHDTSSVVGTCMIYGQNSLLIGTIIKLVRALFIIPIVFLISLFYNKYSIQTSIQPYKKPWFILWFILASTLVTIFPSLSSIGIYLKYFGESLFAVALFLIGYSISFSSLKNSGIKVLFQALILWIIISVLVIIALKINIIK